MAMVNEQPSLGQFHALIVGLGNKSASFLIHLVRLLDGSFTVELKYFRSMPWYKAIFLSNFFNFILVLSTYFMVK